MHRGVACFLSCLLFVFVFAFKGSYQGSTKVRGGIRQSEGQIEHVGRCCLHLGIVITKTCNPCDSSHGMLLASCRAVTHAGMPAMCLGMIHHGIDAGNLIQHIV